MISRSYPLCRLLPELILMAVVLSGLHVKAQSIPRLGDRLSNEQVMGFANLALRGIDQEYPNKPSNVMSGPQSVQSPSEMHPAFFGCFDWHSSVHGHWMLVRLLKHYPKCSLASEIRSKLNQHLTETKLRAEAAYFKLPENRSFERTYGWAWFLRLVAECETWNDPDAQRWRAYLRPLETLLVDRIRDYLPKLTYPIRTGVHPNTAFALGQILDYARIVGNNSLESLVIARSNAYFLEDEDYPLHYEPSGQDFFSAGWNEADLMRRILTQDAFGTWLSEWLPALGKPDAISKPVEVSDVTDGKIVHLAGLDLSRAWCMQGVAASLPKADLRRQVLLQSAVAHARLGFKYVFSGHYEGEHWLATFAVYALDRVGIE
jgi:hypothetical protein